MGNQTAILAAKPSANSGGEGGIRTQYAPLTLKQRYERGQEILALYEEGKTQREIASLIGLSIGGVQYILSGMRTDYLKAKVKRQIKRREARKAAAKERCAIIEGRLAEKDRARQKKIWQILNARAEGKTLAAIGKKRGVSRERIRQLEKLGLDTSYALLRRKNNLKLLKPFLDLGRLRRRYPRIEIRVLVCRLGGVLQNKRKDINSAAWLVRKYNITPEMVLEFYERKK